MHIWIYVISAVWLNVEYEIDRKVSSFSQLISGRINKYDYPLVIFDLGLARTNLQ